MWRNIRDGLLDILYPKVCLSCKNSLKATDGRNSLVCHSCRQKIKRNLPPFCHSCGRHLEKSRYTKHICPACLKKKLHFDRAWGSCLYDGVVKELIHEFKYKGKEHLGPTLSALMVEFIKEYNLPMEYMDLIMPTPLYPARLREREFNQAQVLSHHIGKAFEKRILTDSLIRNRNTRTQTELEEHERFLNVKNSFAVADRENVKNKNILLVDDVLTTAATSSEAAYALKEAGANIVFVLTLAS